MSYILDALRKSDQQRRRGAVPTLTAAPAVAAARERPAFLFYGLLGVVLIALGMTIGWMRPWRSEPVAVTAVAPIAPIVANPLESSPQQQPASAKAEKQVTPPMSVAGKPREAVVTATPEGHAGGPSGGAAEQKLMAISDLPLSIQQEIPAMSVAMHAYSSKPPGRLVSINDRLLREGDTLTPDLKLEQITPDGMIFTYRGYRFRRGIK